MNSRNVPTIHDIIALLILIIPITGVAYYIVWTSERSIRADLVRNGLAEYYLDENGDKQFRYLTAKRPVTPPTPKPTPTPQPKPDSGTPSGGVLQLK